ncbi:GTPase-activator protein [Dictyocaulus viviparus]|uniref:GTPase-activator protein n=1 Tax=Dictyocaulus viviparus TaxID=29172 RepID=A0A0D8XMS9_DICVI|nr:GTPase-activator protein [Dictyocaulus viviparus]
MEMIEPVRASLNSSALTNLSSDETQMQRFLSLSKCEVLSDNSELRTPGMLKIAVVRIVIRQGVAIFPLFCDYWCFEKAEIQYCVHPITRDVRLTRAVLSFPSFRLEDREATVDHKEMSTPKWLPNVTSVETTEDYVNHNFACHTVASVPSLRKSREEKPWKPCWVTLCDHPTDGCELFIADTEVSTKPRLVLHLAYCMMYLLDDSVFSREGCIFFSQTDMELPGVYICFRPANVFIKWVELLRTRVLGLRSNAEPVMIGLKLDANQQQQPFFAILQLHIDKYRSDALKQDSFYSASGMICGIKVCSTPMIAPSVGKGGLLSVIFDCSFLLPLLPPNNGTLQFSLLSHPGGGRKARPFGVSALLSLPDSLPYSDSPELDFTFRATWCRIRVLSQEHYAPFGETTSLFEWASEALSLQQRSFFSWSIVSLLLPNRYELLQLISRLLRRVLAASSAENVMRQDSFTTTLLTQALRIAGRSQLEDAFDAIGVANVKLLQPAEVDQVIDALVRLVSPCSLTHDLLAIVARLANERFPDEPHLVRRVLSTVYILRFANPLLMSYMSGNPVNQQLAKAVQSAANFAAAASSRIEDGTVGSQCLRSLFERIRVNDAKSSVEPSNSNNTESRCCDWMAMICHLLSLALASRERNPKIDPSFLQLIQAHKSSSFP